MHEKSQQLKTQYTVFMGEFKNKTKVKDEEQACKSVWCLQQQKPVSRTALKLAEQ